MAFSGGTGGAGDADEVVVADGSGGIKTADTVKAGTGYISIGATPAAAGTVRLPSAGIVAGRNLANSADVMLCQLSGDNVYVGGDSGLGRQAGITLILGGSVRVVAGSATSMEWDSNNTLAVKPIIGYEGLGSPYGVHGAVSHTFAADADYTVTAAQYRFQKIYFETGSLASNKAVFLPAPATLAEGYSKFIKNNTGFTLTITKVGGAGTTVALLTTTGALVWIDSTGVSLMAAAL